MCLGCQGVDVHADGLEGAQLSRILLYQASCSTLLTVTPLSPCIQNIDMP